MYIEEGSNKGYSRRDGGNVFMWGWLGNNVPSQGWADDNKKQEFLKRVRAAEQRPQRLCRGWHDCGICGGDTFNGEIDFFSNGKIYTAPCGVSHYIEAHNYKPPEEVIAAVLGGSEKQGKDDSD